MQYNEYPPIPQLQPYIKCIWTLTAEPDDPPPDFERIFPDGHAELILHFGEPFEKKENDNIHTQSACFVHGQISTYIEIRPSQNADVLGVRFEPYGLSLFSPVQQYAMTDKEVGSEAAFPKHPGFHEKIRVSGPEERIDTVQDLLLIMLGDNYTEAKTDAIKSVQQAVRMISDSEQSIPSTDLAKALHISTRELERRFREYIGLSPKHLARTFRFQEVLQKKFIDSTLTEIAHSSGYYDQSHFIRDFKAFSGLPPGEFFQQESGLTDFFISSER